MTERRHTVTATRLRIDTAELLDQIRFEGQPVAITRQGKVVGYLIPSDFLEEVEQMDDGIPWVGPWYRYSGPSVIR